MFRINFRDHNGHIFSVAVGAVIGNDGKALFGVFGFRGQDRLLIHFNSGEDHTAFAGGFFHQAGVFYDDVLILFRKIGFYMPSSGNRFTVLFTSGVGRSGEVNYLEPGVVGE